MTVPQSLPSKVTSAFDAAVKEDQVHLYDVLAKEVVKEGELEHLLHVCDGIGAKPPPSPKTPDLTTEPVKDVLAGEWSPGEHIVDLEGYPVVCNLYALSKGHIMAVSPSPFRPQSSDLIPTDIYVAYLLVQAHKAEGQEQLCFFNGGPLSGASQAHLHVQFMPFQSIPPPFDAVARGLPSQPTPAVLPMPYLHLFCSLPSLPKFSSNPSTHDKALATIAVYDAYTALVKLSRKKLGELAESQLVPAGPERNSYNFFMTSTHLHVIPRRERIAHITRKASMGQRDGADTLAMSINGIVLAGYWHVASTEELEDLQAFGLNRILVDSCYDSKLW